MVSGGIAAIISCPAEVTLGKFSHILFPLDFLKTVILVYRAY